ncbi:T9SS type A sorting domain-containing protein [bacterium]|nr:T9SS type A sorting domain-containing protein [bacterium]
MKKLIILSILLLASTLLIAQDSVDVTFYYYPADNPASVHIPGEFNGWNPSSAASQMSYIAEDNSWWKEIRLRVGGPDPLPAANSVPGAYQYKFHDGDWFPDPLNPRQNPSDNNNTYLYINNPTIHLLLPNSTPASGVVRSRTPMITAYLFPAIGSEIDTASIVVTIDGLSYSNIGASYDDEVHQLRYIIPDHLADGVHDLEISASSGGSPSMDATSFTVQADLVQLFTLPAQTWKDAWRLQGAIFNAAGEYDSSISSVDLIRGDSTWSVSVIDGLIDTTISLLTNDNEFTIQALIGEEIQSSAPLLIEQRVNHKPTARVHIINAGSVLIFNSDGSVDPDGGEVDLLWKEDSRNPESFGLEGSTQWQENLPPPTTAGEYFVSLTVTDMDGDMDSTQGYFFIEEDDGSLDIGSYSDNPQWVKNSRIYLLFFKAFTPEGSIAAAIPNLDYIAAMGFNTIWVLPVMEIPGVVDNQINIGYYIVDFMHVESSYGSDQDYKDFVSAAHEMGLHVIQDVTPNHSGDVHAFAEEAALYGDFSQYWHYYQTEYIAHNTNGLNDCFTPEGIHYYCGFSSALLSWDWRDLDARTYMTEVYQYWMEEFGIDGYRFDVYWGPHRKFGEANMGVPVREALKHIKPDIMLLGEDDGTGPGTELLYADQGGGLDVSYDFATYFNSIRNFGFSGGAVSNLHSQLENGGYYPGENSYYLRFMESQDEDRISYNYDSFEKTMPMASVILTAPGIPMVLNGQEVGWGKDMGSPGEPDLNDRRRGIIDWEFGGRDLLTPHYQRLAQIRAQFPAFWQHRKDTNGDEEVTGADESDFDRVETGNAIVYAFLRPYINSNGLTIVNFSSDAQSGILNLAGENLKFENEFQLDSTYWINNHYLGVNQQIMGSELQSFPISLPAYGSAIFTISNNEESVEIPELPMIAGVNSGDVYVPDELQLFQNFPNPFNPITRIRYDLPLTSEVTLNIYNVQGRKISTLVSGTQMGGAHEVVWDGRHPDGRLLSTGVYFAHLRAGQNSRVIKMIFLR